MPYIGTFKDSGSQNSFYKVKGKSYGFKSFPNKSLATFAHAVQSELAPYSAPKVFSPVCRIRVPNYFCDGFDNNGGVKVKTDMVLSNWGYLTEIAKPFNCYSEDCGGDCANDDLCPYYEKIQDLLGDMLDHGIEYTDAHGANLGYVIRNKKKMLVAIDFGAESVCVENDDDWPHVCWDGAEDYECDCEQCAKQYEDESARWGRNYV